MAFNGITISSIVAELKEKLIGGRVYKVQQPEDSELNLIIKNNKDTYRLLISADAGLPLIYLTEETKTSPMQAPNFCMLLRKYIGNGRIVDITQPSFERIISIHIEHLDEMGDLKEKRLIMEMMGRYSNIIFVDENGKIIDSIKRVNNDISSVRLVLPGKTYEFPPSQGKIDPLKITKEELDKVLSKPGPIAKMISGSFTGFSKITGEELVFRAGIDPRKSMEDLVENEKEKLEMSLLELIENIKAGNYEPHLYYVDGVPKEYSSMKLYSYSALKVDPVGNEKMELTTTDQNDQRYESISKLVSDFYSKKSAAALIRQKSQDLRHLINTAVERTAKKYDLQSQQMKDTEDRDKYRIYGELLNTYGYELSGGEKELKCLNYYDNKEITIPLDPDKTASENSKKYFEKYNKKKRTYLALTDLLVETGDDLTYLKSVLHELEIAETEKDLNEIRRELTENGVIKSARNASYKGKKKTEAAKPLHFISSDGHDIYVGKNNLQNDYLTFNFADGNDMWFHAKKMPGSHVIVKRHGKEELSDSVYEEAARLAAYFSSGRKAPKVEIDYTEKKNLKKPPAKKPGFVIYHTNYSMVAEPDIRGISQHS